MIIEPLMPRTELGLRMQAWHVGQWDPVYMVGSLYSAGRPYPDVDIAVDALDRITGLWANRSPTAEGAEDLAEIAAALRAQLAIDHPETVRPYDCHFIGRRTGAIGIILSFAIRVYARGTDDARDACREAGFDHIQQFGAQVVMH